MNKHANLWRTHTYKQTIAHESRTYPKSHGTQTAARIYGTPHIQTHTACFVWRQDQRLGLVWLVRSRECASLLKDSLQVLLNLTSQSRLRCKWSVRYQPQAAVIPADGKGSPSFTSSSLGAGHCSLTASESPSSIGRVQSQGSCGSCSSWGVALV